MAKAPSVSAADVLKELNAVRSNPKIVAQSLRETLPKYKGRTLNRGENLPLQTEEGPSAVQEAIKALEGCQPMPLLQLSDGLCKAAQLHVVDQAQSRRTGHTGSDGSNPFDRMLRFGKWEGSAAENCAYGGLSAKEHVHQLLIDDGVPGRGHRKNILNPSFRVVGIACGPHAVFTTVCVQCFAGGFVPKPESAWPTVPPIPAVAAPDGRITPNSSGGSQNGSFRMQSGGTTPKGGKLQMEAPASSSSSNQNATPSSLPVPTAIKLPSVNELFPIPFEGVDPRNPDTLTRDPRTGIPIISVPPKYAQTKFSQLDGTIMHWFSEVLKTNSNWKNADRICIISDSHVYLLGPDGSIRRSLPVEAISKLEITDKTAERPFAFLNFHMPPKRNERNLRFGCLNWEEPVRILERIHEAISGQPLVVERNLSKKLHSALFSLQEPPGWNRSIAPLRTKKALTAAIQQKQEEAAHLRTALQEILSRIERPTATQFDELLTAHRRVRDLGDEIQRKDSEISQLREQLADVQSRPTDNSAEGALDRLRAMQQELAAAKEALALSANGADSLKRAQEENEELQRQLAEYRTDAELEMQQLRTEAEQLREARGALAEERGQHASAVAEAQRLAEIVERQAAELQREAVRQRELQEQLQQALHRGENVTDSSQQTVSPQRRDVEVQAERSVQFHERPVIRRFEPPNGAETSEDEDEEDEEEESEDEESEDSEDERSPRKGRFFLEGDSPLAHIARKDYRPAGTGPSTMPHVLTAASGAFKRAPPSPHFGLLHHPGNRHIGWGGHPHAAAVYPAPELPTRSGFSRLSAGPDSAPPSHYEFAHPASPLYDTYDPYTQPPASPTSAAAFHVYSHTVRDAHAHPNQWDSGTASPGGQFSAAPPRQPRTFASPQHSHSPLPRQRQNDEPYHQQQQQPPRPTPGHYAVPHVHVHPRVAPGSPTQSFVPHRHAVPINPGVGHAKALPGEADTPSSPASYLHEPSSAMRLSTPSHQPLSPLVSPRGIHHHHQQQQQQPAEYTDDSHHLQRERERRSYSPRPAPASYTSGLHPALTLLSPRCKTYQDIVARGPGVAPLVE